MQCAQRMRSTKNAIFQGTSEGSGGFASTSRVRFAAGGLRPVRGQLGSSRQTCRRAPAAGQIPVRGFLLIRAPGRYVTTSRSPGWRDKGPSINACSESNRIDPSDFFMSTCLAEYPEKIAVYLRYLRVLGFQRTISAFVQRIKTVFYFAL